MKTLFSLTLLAATLFATLPGPVYAVDGVVLINQSTVMAAGGFPYTITQPGSYKLSGNLIPPASVTAILISASNVSLDLNGFAISCSFVGTFSVSCVAEGLSGLQKIAIRNGAIDVSQVGSGQLGNPSSGLSFLSSTDIIIEELLVEVHASFSGLFGGLPFALVLDGGNALVRHNVLRGDNNGFVIPGSTQIACPSLIVENVLSLSPPASNCVVVNNVAAK